MGDTTSIGVLAAHYQELVDGHTVEDDPAQRDALVHLDALAIGLSAYSRPSFPAALRQALKGRFGRATKTPPKGLYLYGGVGRGKSMLMDLFFDKMPMKAKRRVHFTPLCRKRMRAFTRYAKGPIRQATRCRVWRAKLRAKRSYCALTNFRSRTLPMPPFWGVCLRFVRPWCGGCRHL